MGVYHICDFCGRNLDDKESYHIHMEDSESNPIVHVSNELCEDCASQYANVVNRIVALRNDTDWSVLINSPKYKLVDGGSVFRDKKQLVEWSFY